VLEGAQAMSAIAGGFAAGGIAGGNMESAISGAFSAMLFGLAGDLSGAHAAMGGVEFLSQTHLAQVATHSIAGCVSGMIAGGSCGGQAASASFSAFIGPKLPAEGGSVAAIASRAIAGGIGSQLGGDKFANGVVTGAFGYLFNDLGSMMRAEQRQMRSWWRGFHEYSNWTPCGTCTGFDQAAVTDALTTELKAAPAWSGRWQCNDRTCSFAGPGRVWHVDGESDVMNITKLDHGLYPGVLTRTVEARDGVVGIRTYAVGWGFLPRANEFFASSFWGWRDRVLFDRAIHRLGGN
jgi:hypothetical protein